VAGRDVLDDRQAEPGASGAARDPTVALLLLGELRAALPRFEADAVTARSRGRLASELYCRSCVARCEIALGELASGIASCRTADDLAARIPGPRIGWQLVHHLGTRDALSMVLDSGWEAELADLLPLVRPGRPEHQWAIATIEAAAARCHARLGRTDAAMRLLPRPVRALRAAPAWAPNYLRTACDAVETLWLLDRRDHLPALRTVLLDKALPTDFRFPMMDARLALARLCALDGLDDEAGVAFDAARSVLDDQSARPLRAVVDHDQAVLHLRRGDPAAARPFAEAAAEQFRALGMTGWERRLRSSVERGPGL